MIKFIFIIQSILSIIMIIISYTMGHGFPRKFIVVLFVLHGLLGLYLYGLENYFNSLHKQLNECKD